VDWALATTIPHCEHLACRGLERLGCEHRMFKRRISRARRGQVLEQLVPALARGGTLPMAATGARRRHAAILWRGYRARLLLL
jgi:hypothetical protein